MKNYLSGTKTQPSWIISTGFGCGLLQKPAKEETNRQFLWQLKVLKLSHRNRECKMMDFSTDLEVKASRILMCCPIQSRSKPVCLPDESI